MLLDDVRHYRLLTPQEHRQLARAIENGKLAEDALNDEDIDEVTKAKLENFAQEGRDAKSKFVASNIRLVVAFAKNHLSNASSAIHGVALRI